MRTGADPVCLLATFTSRPVGLERGAQGPVAPEHRISVQLNFLPTTIEHVERGARDDKGSRRVFRPTSFTVSGGVSREVRKDGRVKE